MTLLLGVDIGTTATKALVITSDGEVAAAAERPVDLRSPFPGWAEEDIAQWWENVCSLMRTLPAVDVAAVAVSGMTPCVIVLDANGSPLRPSIQQNDARAAAEVEKLGERLDAAGVLERTGSAITQQSVGPTALWLARHEPDIWRATRTIMGSYDYVSFLLCGNRSVERNWALESGLYDFRQDAWAEDICTAAGIDPSLLPPVRQAGDVLGEVTAEAAKATGLRAGTPVIVGSADHVASAFAAGLIEEGDLLIKLGGAGDILLTAAAPVVDHRLYLDFHLAPNTFLPNGCMAASGSFIRWFQRELGNNLALPDLDAEARAAGPGAGGIIALPYVLGEKTPINDPAARGAFVGLHLGHHRGHLFRAVLEGIAFGFRHHLDVFDELGLRPKRVRVSNGGARSTLWKQVTADVIGHPLETLAIDHGSALGVAFVAGKGVGTFPDWRSIESFVTVGEPVEPDLSISERYGELYRAYRDLYPALRPISTAVRRAGVETPA
jgi:xylulokinase